MKDDDEMSEKQAARLIEMYENAIKNGEQWTHDVLFHRGNPKYEKTLESFNRAFQIHSRKIVIHPLRSKANRKEGGR